MVASPSPMATTVTNRQNTTTRMALLRLLAAIRSRKVCGMASECKSQASLAGSLDFETLRSMGRIANPSYRKTINMSKLYLRCLLHSSGLRGVKLEELRRMEAEHAADHVGRECLQGCVVLRHHVVVMLTRETDPVFGRFQFLLQAHEVLIRLEIRISLGDGEQALQRPCQHALRLRLFGNSPGVHGHVACLNYALQRFLFMTRVAFDCLHQVGNEVVAALELHVNLRPGILGLYPLAHQAVVNADQPQHNN